MIPVEAIERVIDDLETKRKIYESFSNEFSNKDRAVVAKSVCEYVIDQLRKVLSDHGKGQ